MGVNMSFKEKKDEMYSEFPWLSLTWKIIIIVLILLLGSCSFKRKTVSHGEKGIVISKPYFFGTQGVRNETLLPGSYWMWKSNELWTLSTNPAQVPEKFDDMMSADNIPVDFDAFLNYVIVNPVSYMQNWGEHWYSSNVQQVFRSAIRDECKRHKMTDLVSNPDVSNRIEAVALAEVVKFAKDKNLPFTFTKVNVGKINPNQDVMKEIAQTAVQQQRQRTEGERKKAEDMRAATERSRAAADNQYREAMGLQPEQYIRLEAVKAYSHAAEECAKNEKCTMILTQPGQTIGINK